MSLPLKLFFMGGKLNCLCRGRRWGRLSSFGVFNGMYHARIMFSFTCFCFRDEIPIYHGSFVPSPSMEYASRVSPTSIMHACMHNIDYSCRVQTDTFSLVLWDIFKNFALIPLMRPSPQNFTQFSTPQLDETWPKASPPQAVNGNLARSDAPNI